MITEVGNQVPPAAERLDATCDDIESGDLTVFDLGHASDAHTHTGSHVPLSPPVLLARLSELMPTGFRQQSTRTGFHLGGIHTGRVQLLLQGLPVLRDLLVTLSMMKAQVIDPGLFAVCDDPPCGWLG